MDYAQEEYTLAYALTFGFLLLGLLVVCIPRPRKSEFVDPVQAEKDKKLKQRDKALARKKKKSNKKKKKNAKIKAKRAKQKG